MVQGLRSRSARGWIAIVKRRTFVLSSLIAGASPVLDQSQAKTNGSGGPTALEEVTVDTLQQRMRDGHGDARSIAEAYLARIRAIDRSGPHLNSIIELNPDALEIAALRDHERKSGSIRGPLHGICVLVKDNVATRDRMHTTAGSLALAHAPATNEATLVTRLRDAGAVILGKTNLSEWANFRSTRSTSGWSGRGGLTRNPYALDRNTSGSSSGSAAAIAANLAAVAIGTETDGSIVSPSSINGLVGIKPTVGLVSRYGIIPISRTQDTAGPMARCVADAAALLSVIAGPDSRDPVTSRSVALDYTKALNPDALRGARLGVVRGLFGDHDLVNGLIETCLQTLIAKGAVLVDPVELPPVEKYGEAELNVLLYEFKDGLNHYLSEFAGTAPIQNLSELIAWNAKNASSELRLFGQELLKSADAKGDLNASEYIEALATCARYARTEGIDAVLGEHRLDALIAPTSGPGWVTDFLDGDHSGASFSTPAAVAGYPHVTVPAGAIWGMPVGLSFVGSAFSEARLIALAYAFEQATHARRPPAFRMTIDVPA